MKTKSPREVLDQALRKRVPEDLNLLPQIATRFAKGKNAMKSTQKRALGTTLALLVLLAALFTWPMAVTALQRLFGYIPSVGYVAQGAPIRVLKAPVSVTRDGITVTINNLIITSEKTFIDGPVFSGVPDSAYPSEQDIILGQGCRQDAYLRLPDGAKIVIELDMPPLPADVNKVTFVLSCIFNTLPGTVPENWELPLEFVPAPPNLTVMPVIEILPSPSPSPEAKTAVAPENILAVTKVLEIGDSYILMGEFRSDIVKATLPAGAEVMGPGSPDEVAFKDVNGDEINATWPGNIEEALWPESAHPEAGAWAFQVNKKFAAPLTMTYKTSPSIPAGPQAVAEFEFDAGEDPQPGQEWLLNKDLDVGGHLIRLVSITVGFQQGYVFRLESDDPQVIGLNLDLAGYTSTGFSGGGSGGPETKWTKNVGINYAKLPTGKLKIVLSNLMLGGESHTYQLQWSPGAMPITIIATPTP
jgi:hypothetical protein